MPKYSKALSISTYKFIEIDKSLITTKLILLAKYYNLTIQISTIFNFKLGYIGKKKTNS